MAGYASSVTGRSFALCVVCASLIALSGCSKSTSKDLSLAKAAQVAPAFADIVAEAPIVGAGGRPQASVLQRLPDCSLTRRLLDWVDLKVVGSTPDFHLDLHRRARLGTTPDVFPKGCSDPAHGLESQAGAVAGVLPDGSYFGASINLRGNGTLTLAVTDRAVGQRSRTDVLVRPAGTELEAEAVTTADIDGSGQDSVIAALANFSDRTGGLAILRPRPKGNFGAARNLLLPFPVSGLTVADLNEDDLTDIVAIGSLPPNPGDPTLAILFGRGAGRFAAPRLIPDATGVGVIAADFNGDEHLDLATSGGQVLLGTGTGRFKAAAPGGWDFGTLAAGDFDEDGAPDIAVSAVDQITIFLGRGNGRFSKGISYAGIYGSQHLVATEIDGDGHLDLLVGYAGRGVYAPHENSPATLQFLLGRGDGSFAGVQVRPGDIGLLADVTGEGKPDLLTVGRFGQDLRFFAGRGGGAFGAQRTVASVFRVGDLAVADFNRDRKTDLLLLAGGNSFNDPAKLQLRAGLGDGSFEADGPEVLMPFPGSFGNRVLVVGDFNGDKRQDVAAVGYTEQFPNPRQGTLAVVRNAGDGSLPEPVTIASDLVGPADLAVARVDADDTLDIVVLDNGNPFSSPSAPGSVRVYRGRGNGSFRPPIVLQPFANPDAVAVADLNGDGLGDLLVTGSGPQGEGPQLAVLLGTGSGFGAPLLTPTTEFGIGGIAAGDIDGDGRLDVALTACCGLAYNSYLIGRGNGRFRPEVVLPTPISGSRPQLVDLDGDGRAEWAMSLPTLGSAVLRNISGQSLAAAEPGSSTAPSSR